jgi:hypothetical protein
MLYAITSREKYAIVEIVFLQNVNNSMVASVN